MDGFVQLSGFLRCLSEYDNFIIKWLTCFPFHGSNISRLYIRPPHRFRFTVSSTWFMRKTSINLSFNPMACISFCMVSDLTSQLPFKSLLRFLTQMPARSASPLRVRPCADIYVFSISLKKILSHSFFLMCAEFVIWIYPITLAHKSFIWTYDKTVSIGLFCVHLKKVADWQHACKRVFAFRPFFTIAPWKKQTLLWLANRKGFLKHFLKLQKVFQRLQKVLTKPFAVFSNKKEVLPNQFLQFHQ